MKPNASYEFWQDFDEISEVLSGRAEKTQEPHEKNNSCNNNGAQIFEMQITTEKIDSSLAQEIANFGKFSFSDSAEGLDTPVEESDLELWYKGLFKKPPIQLYNTKYLREQFNLWQNSTRENWEERSLTIDFGKECDEDFKKLKENNTTEVYLQMADSKKANRENVKNLIKSYENYINNFFSNDKKFKILDEDNFGENGIICLIFFVSWCNKNKILVSDIDNSAIKKKNLIQGTINFILYSKKLLRKNWSVKMIMMIAYKNYMIESGAEKTLSSLVYSYAFLKDKGFNDEEIFNIFIHGEKVPDIFLNLLSNIKEFKEKKDYKLITLQCIKSSGLSVINKLLYYKIEFSLKDNALNSFNEMSFEFKIKEGSKKICELIDGYKKYNEPQSKKRNNHALESGENKKQKIIDEKTDFINKKIGKQEILEVHDFNELNVQYYEKKDEEKYKNQEEVKEEPFWKLSFPEDHYGLNKEIKKYELEEIVNNLMESHNKRNKIDKNFEITNFNLWQEDFFNSKDSDFYPKIKEKKIQLQLKKTKANATYLSEYFEYINSVISNDNKNTVTIEKDCDEKHFKSDRKICCFIFLASWCKKKGIKIDGEIWEKIFKQDKLIIQGTINFLKYANMLIKKNWSLEMIYMMAYRERSDKVLKTLVYSYATLEKIGFNKEHIFNIFIQEAHAIRDIILELLICDKVKKEQFNHNYTIMTAHSIIAHQKVGFKRRYYTLVPSTSAAEMENSTSIILQEQSIDEIIKNGKSSNTRMKDTRMSDLNLCTFLNNPSSPTDEKQTKSKRSLAKKS